MSFNIAARLTYSFLDSGRVIARAANVAALIAGAGLLLPSPSLSHWIFAASLLCWMAECWLAMRVAVDASLFRVLAEGDADAAGKELDVLPIGLGFRHAQQTLTPGERTRGALRLWRAQIAACAAELILLAAAGILRLGSI